MAQKISKAVDMEEDMDTDMGIDTDIDMAIDMDTITNRRKRRSKLIALKTSRTRIKITFGPGSCIVKPNTQITLGPQFSFHSGDLDVINNVPVLAFYKL